MPADRLERLRAARLHHQRRFADVDALVRGTLGLHSTDYASPYFSAWARIDGFDAAGLFARLGSGEGLVRMNAYRNTVHVVHVDDLALISAATGAAVGAVGRKSPGLKARTDAEIRRGVDAVMGALESGPLATNALKEALPALAADMRYWLIAAMGTGEVVRADSPHARSNRSRYALTRQWLPGYTPSDLTPAEARREVLVRAVGTFGPITEADLAWWLPATRGEVTKALASMKAQSLTVDGTKYWFTAELADSETPPRDALGAWLLPYEDALLKGYKDRAWCLAPGLREVLFPFSIAHWHPPDGRSPGPGPHPGANVTGEARPSIWWAGRVVGRWEEGKASIVHQLHADVGREGEAEIEAAIGRLARFVAEDFEPIAS